MDAQVADAMQKLGDELLTQVAQVQMHERLAADTATLVDLGLDRTCDHIARSELRVVRRVARHETVA
jgi:hypothetical protein